MYSIMISNVKIYLPSTTSETILAIIILIAFLLTLDTIFRSIRMFWKKSDREIVYGLPILGSLFELTPHSAVETLMKYSKTHGHVVDIFILHKRITILSGIDEMKEILMRRPKIFKRGPRALIPFAKIGLREGVLAAEGTVWSAHRKVSAPPFSKQNVSKMLDGIWQHSIHFSESLLKLADGTTPHDFVPLSTFFTIRVIGEVAFGFTENDGSYFYSKQFFEDMKTMLVYVTQRTLFRFPQFLWEMTSKFEYEKRAVIASKRVQQCGREVIAHARESPLDDTFIKNLLKAGNEHKMTDAEIISNVLTIFVAGSDTTAIGVCWTLFFLAQYPSIADDVRNEVNALQDSMSSQEKLSNLRFCTAVFTEAMRLRGPVAFAPFMLADDIQQFTLESGLKIDSSDVLFLNFDAVKQDPLIFDDPEEFHPYRWFIDDKDKLVRMHTACLTFGGGPRVCPGADLALSEGTFAIANILKSFHLELGCPPNEIFRFLALTTQINKMPIILKPI